VSGVKEQIEGMLKRYGELSEEVGRLEGLVEDQRKDLEMQNSSRLGGIYDDDDGSVVTQSMVDEEEEQVRLLEEKIKSMQQKVSPPFGAKLI
jgi:polyhydroxyalkanoate synthesis regulator phasin